ncbi:SDR family NAD(P)-dependent oxidoreductase [Nocardia jiangxiensis]|uniref:SDR family NAD(P)-dependent oxidoreductase n=1 Tax=Nocardia jiangxiensis TaxID=282685 RepID=UPI0002FF0C9E|nr:SDR family oxidoreductase [Nocardia jiangxiensis]
MTEQRRYLITGGTSGIGAMCARHLTAEGNRVWVTGTRDSSVRAAVQAGDAAGGSVSDVAEAATVETAFDEAVHALGGLDGVFLNAGIDGQGLPAEQLSAETFQRVLQVNVVGALHCAQAAYRRLDRPGVILINSSVNAIRPERHFADYNAGKAAVASLAQSLALDWSDQQLTVIALCPGYFRTRMTEQYLDDPQVSAELLARIPAGRFGREADVGATVSFLLSGRAEFLTGALIPLAGASNI